MNLPIEKPCLQNLQTTKSSPRAVHDTKFFTAAFQFADAATDASRPHHDFSQDFGDVIVADGGTLDQGVHADDFIKQHFEQMVASLLALPVNQREQFMNRHQYVLNLPADRRNDTVSARPHPHPANAPALQAPLGMITACKRFFCSSYDARAYSIA